MTVRPPAVAGQFYPGNAKQLRADVEEMLADATQVASPSRPQALVVPHAGYVYSGPVAATAYAALRPFSTEITRVLLLGPSHRVGFRGLALPGVDRFATPLGEIPVDTDGVKRAQSLPGVVTLPKAHALEHSLEVHLPFLQVVLGRFTLLPLCVGDSPVAEVANVLNALWGGPETLRVISTDLSHYLPYDDARAIDATTVSDVIARHTDVTHEQACGATPLNGLLQVAQQRGLKVTALDVRSSGDTAGTRDRVVGYASFALS